MKSSSVFNVEGVLGIERFDSDARVKVSPDEDGGRNSITESDISGLIATRTSLKSWSEVTGDS